VRDLLALAEPAPTVGRTLDRDPAPGRRHADPEPIRNYEDGTRRG
jgi:hypothetical protein